MLIGVEHIAMKIYNSKDRNGLDIFCLVLANCIVIEIRKIFFLQSVTVLVFHPPQYTYQFLSVVSDCSSVSSYCDKKSPLHTERVFDEGAVSYCISTWSSPVLRVYDAIGSLLNLIVTSLWKLGSLKISQIKNVSCTAVWWVFHTCTWYYYW